MVLEEFERMKDQANVGQGQATEEDQTSVEKEKVPLRRFVSFFMLVVILSLLIVVDVIRIKRNDACKNERPKVLP